jgi:DNA-binding CsgD family transcriptional regulator
LPSRHQEICELFRADDSEDVLWEKLHEFAGEHYQITSALYGFTHSKYTIQRVGITDSLFMRHSHPQVMVDQVGEGKLLENDSASMRLVSSLEPFLWSESLDWEGVTQEQRDRFAVDEACGMVVGLTMGFSFADGMGVAGLGLCAGATIAEGFAKIWHENREDLLALGQKFDEFMRPAMVNGRINLPPREKEVLALATGGMSAKQIAHHLKLQPKTIFNIMERARKSLQANNTMEAIAKACVYGLLKG